MYPQSPEKDTRSLAAGGTGPWELLAAAGTELCPSARAASLQPAATFSYGEWKEVAGVL